MLPSEPVGSLAVTDSVKLGDVVVAGSGITVLVGGVRSMVAVKTPGVETLPAASSAVTSS